LKRAIQSVIEDPLSEKILADEFPEGSTVTAGFRNGEVTFSARKGQVPGKGQSLEKDQSVEKVQPLEKDQSPA